MSPDRPHESSSEARLRARLAAGSRDVDDYLDLADLLQDAARWDEALEIYEQGRGRAVEKLTKAKVTVRLSLLHQNRMDRKAGASLAREALALVRDEADALEVSLIRGCSQPVLAQAVWVDDPKVGAAAARLGVRWLERVIEEDNASRDAATAQYEMARLHNALNKPDRAGGDQPRCQGITDGER
jgi:hypothetical protein